MRALAFAMPGLLAASACSAAPAPSRTGHPVIDAFIADIAAGRRAAAIDKISSMESASGFANAAETPGAFVDKLLSCSFSSSEPPRNGFVMYDTIWRCPDGEYWALIDPDYRPPRLTIGQFVSTATRQQWRQMGPAPPVAPAPAPKGR